jgi:dihydrofolate reductase
VGKLVVSQFVTVDGVIEDPGGSEGFERGGWAFDFDRGEEGDKFKLDEVFAADALLLGRTTYEGFAAAWPTRTGEFADKFNTMRKYVVSTTLESPDWNNSVVVKGDVAAEVSRLTQEHDGDVLVNGSAQLVRKLLDDDLVDEYRLMVFPVVLGSGKRLFSDGARRAPLRLVDSKPVGRDGVIILTYQRAAKEEEAN